MTKPTGNPPGRPRGARNRRTVATEAAALAAAEKIGLAVPGAFEGDAHAFLMSVYKDPAQPIDLRLDAAGKAIRYERPALASIDLSSVNEHVVHMVSSEPLSQEEWEGQFCESTGKPQ